MIPRVSSDRKWKLIQNHREKIPAFLQMEGTAGGKTGKGCKETSESGEYVPRLDGVDGFTVYKHAKAQQVVHFKYVQQVVCQLDLCQAVEKCNCSLEKECLAWTTQNKKWGWGRQIQGRFWDKFLAQQQKQ